MMFDTIGVTSVMPTI